MSQVPAKKQAYFKCNVTPIRKTLNYLKSAKISVNLTGKRVLLWIGFLRRLCFEPSILSELEQPACSNIPRCFNLWNEKLGD